MIPILVAKHVPAAGGAAGRPTAHYTPVAGPRATQGDAGRAVCISSYPDPATAGRKAQPTGLGQGRATQLVTLVRHQPGGARVIRTGVGMVGMHAMGGGPESRPWRPSAALCHSRPALRSPLWPRPRLAPVCTLTSDGRLGNVSCNSCNISWKFVKFREIFQVFFGIFVIFYENFR